MISTALFQLVLLPIYDNRRNLLIHEDEDGGEYGEHRREEGVHPPRIDQRMLCDHESVYHHPTSSRRWLKRVWHDQFRRVHVGQVAQERHGKNSNGHGKVGQEVTDLPGQISGVAEILQWVTYGKGAEEQNGRLKRENIYAVVFEFCLKEITIRKTFGW